jgi:hypothetical protein
MFCECRSGRKLESDVLPGLAIGRRRVSHNINKVQTQYHSSCIPPSLTLQSSTPFAQCYRDSDETLEPYSVESLDVDREQEVITRCIHTINPAIQIKFEMATVERFGTFFAMGKGRALHFSCHGGSNGKEHFYVINYSTDHDGFSCTDDNSTPHSLVLIELRLLQPSVWMMDGAT